MQANSQSPTPESKTGEQPELAIAFAVIVPPLIQNLLVFPPNNIAGLTMLGMVIGAGLRERGLVFTGTTAGAELNNARGLYSVASVANRLEGLKALQECLQKCHLLGFSHIAWLDLAEGIWRPWYPQGTAIDFNELVSERVMEELWRQADVRLEAYKIAQQFFPRPNES
jgi:hypothetical protein